MDPLTTLIDQLLAAVAKERVLWPDVGVFGLYTRRRMPGFPAFTRVQFWPAEHLFRLLNDGDTPPNIETAPVLATDLAFAARVAKSVADELLARGEVSIPGFGLFGVEKRKTTAEDQYTVVFHSHPTLLRRLNPADKEYDAAVATEWPNGLPGATPPDDSPAGPN